MPVAELHDWARPAFVGVKSLNRIQSRIYEAAYRGNENLLVCAPTGAGKTNIAMMTVLREVSKHVDETTGDFFEDAEDFKIVYVAPMKALAAEVTAAFSRRLAPRKNIPERRFEAPRRVSRRASSPRASP